MALNVTTAAIASGANTAIAQPSLAQWDQGQILKIEGVELPQSYQVEFSGGGTVRTVPMIGTAEGVQIPNKLLQSSHPITAHIVLHESATDRETEYWITIYVKPRQAPETVEIDPADISIIDQTIAAAQQAVATSTAQAEAAARSAEGAAASAEAAEASAQAAAGSASAAASSASAAAGSATAAASAQTAAETAQGAAETAQAAAEQAVTDAQAAGSQAVEEINEAKTAGIQAIDSEAATQINQVGRAGATQIRQINELASNQMRSIETKTTQSIDSIEDARDAAVDDVQTEGQTQTSAAQAQAQAAASSATAAANSASAAAGSASAAATARTGAETAAASVSASAAQIAQNASDITDLNRQISDLSENVDKQNTLTRGKNILDFNGSTEGYYLNVQGVPAANSDWAYTDYIPISGNTPYIMSYDTTRTNNDQPYYFYSWYNSNKEFLSGGIKSGVSSAITSPDLSAYVRISYQLAFATYMQFESGTVVTFYEQAYTKIIRDLYKPKTITVSNEQTLKSVFDTLQGLCRENPYIVEISEGTYNTLDGFTSAEQSASGFVGLKIPKWVTLRGVGNKSNIILAASFDTANQNVSTLNLSGSASLENLTIKGTKTRYAVHDDFGYGEDNICKRYVKNCDFIARNCYHGAAYGSGVRSGAQWIFENCLFDADTSNPFVIHSQNYSFSIPADVTLKNCTMLARGLMGLRVGGMNSSVINRLHLIGCNLYGIYVAEEISGSGSGIDWKIDGYGNTPAMLERFVVTDGKQYYTEFSDEMQYFKAQVAISKNNVIYRVGAGCAIALNNNKMPCGVALADTAVGDMVPVKIRGSIDLTDYGITVALADIIKVSNGAFVVDNSATAYIGVVNNTEQYPSMKLAGLLM